MSRFAQLCVLLGVIGFSVEAIGQDAGTRHIDFVYLGGSDCPYCRDWEANDLPKLKASTLFQHVRYTKITKTIHSPVPGAFWFPDEIKQLREPIAEKIHGTGSPMFSILTDGHVVASWKGTKKSPAEILKIIEQEEQPTAEAN